MSLGLGGALFSIPGRMAQQISGLLNLGDVEEKARQFLQPKFGEDFTDIFLRGVPAKLGVDMSRSIALGDIIPEPTLAGLIGAPASMIDSLARGGKMYIRSFTEAPFGPERRDALELLSPTFLKNIMQAARLQEEGLRTRSGGRIPGEISQADIGKKLIGFQPLSVAKARARQRAERRLISQRRFTHSRALEEIARATLSNDQERLNLLFRAIQEQNARAQAEGKPEDIIQIDANALRQKVAEMVSPAARLRRTPGLIRPRILEQERLFGTQ